jgi:hypothetical protein
MDRAEAVRRAIKCVEQEGFVFTDEERAVFKRLAQGEISSDEYRAIYLAKIERLRRVRPELFWQEV